MADRCAGRINDVRCSRPNAHDGPCSFADPEAAAALAKLRRDRDELVEALDEEHLRWKASHRSHDCAVCRLIDRVNGR